MTPLVLDIRFTLFPPGGLAPAVKAGLVAAGVALAVGAFTLNRYLIGVYYDDGLYAGLALALARGAGYVHLHLPGSPAAVHYPPLYPLVLAPIFGLLPIGAAGVAAKVLNLVLGALAAGLIAWHAARNRLLGDAPWWVGAGTVAAASVAIPVLRTQSVLFSEPLWSVLFALTIISTDSPSPRWRPELAYLVAGGFAALAFLTRSITVVVGGALPLYVLAVRREPWHRAAVLVAPVALAVIGWSLWVGVHRAGIDPAIAFNYGSLNEPLRQAGWTFVAGNVADLPRPLAAITLTWVPVAAARIVVGLAALVVLGAGLVLLTRRSSVGITLVAYGAVLVVWPFVSDRFIWAVLPWIALAFVAGAMGAWRRQRRLQAPVALVVTAVGLGYGLYESRGLAGRSWETPARHISDNLSELLPGLDSLPRQAVIATDNEALAWLYTGRQAVPLAVFAWQGNREAVPAARDHRAYLERNHVTHVLLASPAGGTARQLRALMGADPGWLTPVQSWPGGRWLFAVTP